MIAVRFLFGMGEAGCFPNLTRAFSTWLRPEERVRGQSILWLGARWGGAFTPLLVAGVLAVVSWRVSFSIFAWLGVVWAVVFYRWFRDEPGDHPSVNDSRARAARRESARCPPRPSALAPVPPLADDLAALGAGLSSSATAGTSTSPGCRSF